jgi:hypothetical protein
MGNATLVEQAHRVIQNTDIEKALRSYARDLGVSIDHVIVGALQMVAEDYNAATGNGTIPCLQP